jgi:Mg2+ and Co2+ transporter CorA
VFPLLGHLISSYVALALFVFAALMVLHFLAQYLGRGVALLLQLKRLHVGIEQCSDTPITKIKARLSDLFKNTQLEFAWGEYEETLHEQYELAEGERRIAAIRATLPADSFINSERVVDARIGSEYFKHLPGILTGLGIIGTFYGLIEGLTQFDPSTSDTTLLRRSVTGLFEHVQEAFTFSAIAISCAISVTFFEKWLYASCVARLGRISQALDSLFRAGVGEEYLSGVLQASQENATQVRQLKEAMVTDLKELLTNLTDRQIAATNQLSSDLSARIHESLQEPLADLARTVRETSGRQHEAVGGVLEQLMTSFLAQMRETMGGQLGDLSSLMGRAAESMTSVEVAMKGLAADLQRAGQDSASSVQSAVRDLMQQLAAHQRSQGESVAATVQGVLQQLQENLGRIAAAEEESARRRQIANEATATEMKSRVALIADANAATMAATRETLDRFGSLSGELIDKLTAGAGSVAAAVGALQPATERLGRLASEVSALESQTRQAAQSSMNAIQQATASLASAAERVSSGIAQLAGTAARLEAVAKLAAQEGDVRSQLLKDIQEVATRTQAASAQFERLTQQVHGTLQSSIEEFGSQVSKVLSEHLHVYQKELGDAVGMLSGALAELAEYAAAEAD